MAGHAAYHYNYKKSYKDYRDKQELLSEYCTEVTPREFYDDIFPDEDLERPGHPGDRKSNMIIAVEMEEPAQSQSAGDKGTDEGKDKDKDKVFVRNIVLFAGKAGLEQAEQAPLALCGMCSYSGRRRTGKNAYKCHGFAFDLDGVGREELCVVFYAIQARKIPAPQYIVNSGHGLHLYYIFQRPIPLYPAVRLRLRTLKIALTRVIWTNETSYIHSQPNKDMRDYLGIYQQMRMPGSCSKIGKGKARYKYLVTAYRYTSVRTTLTELNIFVAPSAQVPIDTEDPSSWDAVDHVSLAEAKIKWPDWYQKRVIDKRPAGKYHCSRGLYDWWLKKIQTWDTDAPEGVNDWNSGARDGTRYWCIAALFIYAIKCDVPKAEVMADALSLVPLFDKLTNKPDNQFTVKDVRAAATYYNLAYVRVSRDAIELKTHIKMPKDRRNGRDRETHVKLMSAMRDVLHPDGTWRNKDGRPDKQGAVHQWQQEHPDGTKAQCIRQTGLSKKTVYKWWGK